MEVKDASEIIQNIQTWSPSNIESEVVGSITDYVPMVLANPRLSDLAHARVFHMIESAGADWTVDDYTGERKPKYSFFDGEIFGIDETIAKIVDYFNSGGRRLPVRKRILLLMGPVGGGKSTIVSILKRGLGRYTSTDEGAIYGIQGCPIHEDPLHVLPDDIRRQLYDQSKGRIFVEGDLCPTCRNRQETEFGGDWRKFQIARVSFGELHRRGIGTYTPSDPKCVALDTLIPTSSGLLTIAELCPAPDIVPGTFSPIERDVRVAVRDANTTGQASAYLNNGVQEAVRIRTQLGLGLECTKVHPVFALHNGRYDWVVADDLEVGDKVAVRYATHMFGQDGRLSEDRARLVGYWVAEGSSYRPKNNVEWSTTAHWLAQDILGILDREWGYQTKWRETRVIASTKEISDWMHENVIAEQHDSGAYHKTVPQIVRNSSRRIQVEFLKGLFSGDGCFRSRDEGGYVVKLGTASKVLATQVQAMLLNMGYVSGRSTYVHQYNGSIQHEVTIYGDHAVAFARELDVCDQKLVDDFDSIEATGCSNVELIEGVRDDVDLILRSACSHMRRKWGRYGSSHASEHQRRFTRASALKFLSEVESEVDTHRPDLQEACGNIRCAIDSRELWLEITSIESIGSIPVADLTVDGDHCFITNGIVSHNSQDISELIGSTNLAKLAEIGVESDPSAYQFNGEINVSNRGLLEMVEMLKSDIKHLQVLLTVTQERQVKTPRFPMCYVDVCVVAHTNETEWNNFMAKRENEALQDRIITIPCPYVLTVSDEVKIYRKELESSEDCVGVAIAPLTLDVCAMFSILSRLEPPKDAKIDIVKKMKAYDGQDVKDLKPADVRRMKKDAEREGMDGIGPRQITDAISSAITAARQQMQEMTDEEYAESCYGISRDSDDPVAVDAIDMFKVMLRMVEQDPRYKDARARERLRELIEKARVEFDDLLKRSVQRAFCYEFKEEADTLFRNYLRNIVASCMHDQLRDDITGEQRDPDDKLMSSVEKMIKVGEGAAREFREGIMRRMAAATMNGRQFDISTYGELQDAIERRIFEDRKDTISITSTAKHPDPEQMKELNRVIRHLVDEGDQDQMIRYTTYTAAKAVRYVGKLLNR